MKLTDTKKFRNLRVSKEKFRARDKRENQIGQFIGYLDCQGNEILSGSLVQVDGYLCIVLWLRENSSYACLYGNWYKDRNPLDADSYGKVQFCFPKRQKRLMTVKLEAEQNI